MKHNVFPVRFWAVDNRGWAQCPELARRVWLRIKDARPWYAADMEILSSDSIKLFVYDMADSVSGGIGNLIHEQVITEFTSEEKVLLDQLVENIYTDAAEQELERRERRDRELAIVNLRKEMFGF